MNRSHRGERSGLAWPFKGTGRLSRLLVKRRYFRRNRRFEGLLRNGHSQPFSQPAKVVQPRFTNAGLVGSGKRLDQPVVNVLRLPKVHFQGWDAAKRNQGLFRHRTVLARALSARLPASPFPRASRPMLPPFRTCARRRDFSTTWERELELADWCRRCFPECLAQLILSTLAHTNVAEYGHMNFPNSYDRNAIDALGTK